jgi:hypothetical protein
MARSLVAGRRLPSRYGDQRRTQRLRLRRPRRGRVARELRRLAVVRRVRIPPPCPGRAPGGRAPCARLDSRGAPGRRRCCAHARSRGADAHARPDRHRGAVRRPRPLPRDGHRARAHHRSDRVLRSRGRDAAAVAGHTGRGADRVLGLRRLRRQSPRDGPAPSSSPCAWLVPIACTSMPSTLPASPTSRPAQRTSPSFSPPATPTSRCSS